MKEIKDTIKIENKLISDLKNCLTEFRNKTLDEESLLMYFRDFLLDAKVNSNTVVNILERDYFGEIGKEIARSIKVEEGW